MRRPSLLLLGLLAFAATGCCLNVSGGRSSCLSSSSWSSKSHSETCHCGARKNGKTSLFSGFGRSKQASLPSRPGPLFAGDSWGTHPFSGMNSCVECGGCGEPAMPIMTGCGECSSCAPMPDCSSPMVTGCHAPSCAQPVMQPDCHAPTCAQPMTGPDCHAPHVMIGPGPDCSGPLAVPSCVAPPMPGCAMPAPMPGPQPHNHAAPVPPEYAPPPAPVPPSTELAPAPAPSAVPGPAPTPVPAGDAVPMPVNDLPPAGTPVDPVSWEVPAFPPIK